MKKNVGTVDRIIRLIIGFSLAVTGLAMKFAFAQSGWVPIALIILGIIILFTAAIGFCLLYLPFGINTSNVNKAQPKVIV